MTDEEWRRIPGFEGYEVSSIGRVRSVDRLIQHCTGRTQFRRGAMRKTHPHPGTGHLLIKLRRDNAVESCRVHMLVMRAFVGPCPDGMEVCHNNGIADDNRLENLRYASRSENIRDAVRHGTHNMTRKTHCKWGHPFNEANTVSRPGGGRECLTCRLERRRVRYQRDRTLAA